MMLLVRFEEIEANVEALAKNGYSRHFSPMLALKVNYPFAKDKWASKDQSND